MLLSVNHFSLWNMHSNCFVSTCCKKRSTQLREPRLASSSTVSLESLWKVLIRVRGAQRLLEKCMLWMSLAFMEITHLFLILRVDAECHRKARSQNQSHCVYLCILCHCKIKTVKIVMFCVMMRAPLTAYLQLYSVLQKIASERARRDTAKRSIYHVQNMDT